MVVYSDKSEDHMRNSRWNQWCLRSSHSERPLSMSRLRFFLLLVFVLVFRHALLTILVVFQQKNLLFLSHLKNDLMDQKYSQSHN
jgi:hypothetical protein